MKEAFEHRGWQNWNRLTEHYSGDRHSHTAGTNQIRTGFEPTLSRMMAEMLRAGQATPDELYAALDVVVRRNTPLHADKDAADKGGSSGRTARGSHGDGDDHAGDERLTRDEIGISEESDVEERRAPPRQMSRGRRLLSHRVPRQWIRLRAPWTQTTVDPWRRHRRLMSEFRNPEDTRSAGIPGSGGGDPPYDGSWDPPYDGSWDPSLDGSSARHLIEGGRGRDSGRAVTRESLGDESLTTGTSHTPPGTGDRQRRRPQIRAHYLPPRRMEDEKRQQRNRGLGR